MNYMKKSNYFSGNPSDIGSYMLYMDGTFSSHGRSHWNKIQYRPIQLDSKQPTVQLLLFCAGVRKLLEDRLVLLSQVDQLLLTCDAPP